jgi:hypothetical protein
MSQEKRDWGAVFGKQFFQRSLAYIHFVAGEASTGFDMA